MARSGAVGGQGQLAHTGQRGSDHDDVPIVEVVEVLADLGEANRVRRFRPLLGVEQPAAVVVVQYLLLLRLCLVADAETVSFKRPQRPEALEGGFLQGDDVALGKVGNLVLLVGMGEDESVVSLTAGEIVVALAAVETVVPRFALELVFALAAFEVVVVVATAELVVAVAATSLPRPRQPCPCRRDRVVSGEAGEVVLPPLPSMPSSSPVGSG